MIHKYFSGRIQNNEGAVMVLVLLVLVATILIGTTLMRSATIETKIAGNERRVIQNFNKVDSASEIALVHSTTFADHVKDNVGMAYDFTTSGILSGEMIDLETLTVTLQRRGNPPTAMNEKYVYSVAGKTELEARYYKVDARHQGENVDVLVFKILPRAQKE
ncbi:MAG: pilus assembly PilX N-terminal domain-containing protein [Deltaproteobacteria bacterium]|nr:pilus assembly PilX N-terminal domain-containing protein [Deltaproteobacteria bacterium]MDX9763048.1 pilus assembly PilX N-terminal domain-containing protein [Desulfomonilia bacterium]HPW68976.1 pilus assembly PilX N-terminal domain-containing protein [Deltaproteobacteria bacterium]